MDYRKRGRPEAKSNGSPKKSKSESQPGSKSKPCLKFFSIDGCPFGENCHFLHYFPGGYNAVAQTMSLLTLSTQSNVQNNVPTTLTKSKLCNKYNTKDGCKFGDKCHFAHGPSDLGKPIHEDPQNPDPNPTRLAPPPAVTATFGATATAKISIDGSLAGAIIGKSGVNSKQICRQTGVKLVINDHESDSKLKNIELEGTFEQIQEASAMVRKLIGSLSLSTHGPSTRGALPVGLMGNYKTKLCENFVRGDCTFGEKCHFAHGDSELRKSGV